MPAGTQTAGTGCSNPPLAASRSISYKTKRAVPKKHCSWCGRGDSNLWPLESENSDIQTETASRRDSLSLLHKFARCAKRRQSLFPCPLAALRGVGSQIVVSPAQSWMANSTESFRRKGTASIAYIPARKAISYGKMVILWTFASSSDKGAFPSAPLKREYGEAVD